MRTLVVEDNSGIREVVVDLLTRRGHEVAAYADAESAWEATRHEVYQIAVLDWGLPGMDGVELCRRLRARPGGQAGVILILTGRADPDDIDEVVGAGADDYLTKPFKLDWLAVRIAFAERKVADLAERAKTAEALRQSEARYRTLVEQIPVVTYIHRADGDEGMIYVSPRVETLLGYTPEECLGGINLWKRALHPDDVERVVAASERCRRTGEPCRLEYRLRHRDGSYVWIRHEADYVRDGAGRPLWWQGVLVDITEQRRSADALRESERRQR